MLTFKKKILILFLVCCSPSMVFSQTVFEPSYHTVYPFLSRLAQKGVIDLNDIVLPLSKDVIYQKLDELSKKITELTLLEREELSFYLKEYTLWWRNDPKAGFEGSYKSVLSTEIGDRFRVASYQDKDFAINIQPIVGFKSESINGYSLYENSKGFWTYGYLGKNIGFSLDFRAKSEVGRLGDYLRVFSQETGVIGTKPNFKSFDYNETNATVTGSWSWGKFSIGKNYLTVGYGEGGKIILSDKAPSYPHIRLDVSPKNWLSFTYVHAWLNSLVIDSTSIHPTSDPFRKEFQYRSKFLATHNITFRPWRKVSFMLGESAVYSDRLRIEYLIPLSLFSGMSHYMGELTNNSVSNSSIYSQISLRNLIKSTHFYASFFIDELRLKTIQGDSTNSRNHTAYQLGLSITDIPIKNITIAIEYTKVQPFAYIHFLDTQTYKNNGYNLGHWIGPNADQFYVRMLYRIKRGLELNLNYQFTRKGTEGSSAQQIADNRNLYPFLWGDVTNYTAFSVRLQYEPVHDLFLRFGYNHDDKYIINQNSSNLQDKLYFSINFGF
ncbi:capsule assembly Wzi family protein [Flectobacillus roseus]|uniref:capsule assembly Wzi family protein n=1 Tax=Flectobacillus roseus TaxID=502259 RepID=UPI0024B636F7|nr:capsule assembly Wzi family protein [Flectobacillus roseus]MDI9872485.1 capsule assembly Wzi family protein [Flectobacillus roseus]